MALRFFKYHLISEIIVFTLYIVSFWLGFCQCIPWMFCIDKVILLTNDSDFRILQMSSLAPWVWLLKHKCFSSRSLKWVIYYVFQISETIVYLHQRSKMSKEVTTLNFVFRIFGLTLQAVTIFPYVSTVTWCFVLWGEFSFSLSSLICSLWVH